MNLKDCYKAMEGNYDEAVRRLRSEGLVQKFVLRFLDDGSYDLLCRSVEAGDCEEAFRAAHTIKGVCQNLSLTRLQASSSALAEALRGGSWSEDAPALVRQVQADYQMTAGAIRAFREAVMG